jgi:putative ABC transport system permease protein
MAFANLRRRVLRTSLTVLAIVIGATLIALMVSLGQGLQTFIINQFGLMVSPETITVTKSDFGGFARGSPHEISDNETVEIITPFTRDEMTEIGAIEGVERIDFIVNFDALAISPEESDKLYSLFANSVPYYEVILRNLVSGTHFTEDATGQCLISYDYLGLFGWPDTETAMGKEVTITIGKLNPFDQTTKEYSFIVSGIIQQSISNKEVLIPVDDAIEMARFYQGNPDIYTQEEPGFILQVKAANNESVGSVAQSIEELGYSTVTSNEILDEINSTFDIIQIGLSAFGIIALIVASIGIINTLVMAIYERTREIGVMKAVGATKGTIRLLFTIEGGALGVVGGVIGVIGAFIIGQALNIVGSRTFLSDFPNFDLSVFPPWLLLGVVVLTTVVSLIAGLYPANRAANLDPVDALRYE